MYAVRIERNTEITSIQAHQGELLSSLLIRAGMYMDHPCGGRGTCKKCIVSVDGEEQLSCQYTITKDCVVCLPETTEIVSYTESSQGDYFKDKTCFILDLGTTTLALALVSLSNKHIIQVKTRMNPQRVFGADIISRISYCKENGVDKLQKAVITTVNQMIAEFHQEFGCNAETLYISGNTTMLHLFFGEDCSGMGVSPYTPIFLESQRKSATALGISGVEKVVSLPNISTFIGADIAAGLNYAEMPREGMYNILIDLGTNAEIVLYNDTSLFTAAASAGPCFEGTNITCGMSAVSGAVYAYEDGKVRVIGGGNPKGICGTGLIDCIAYFLKNKIVDNTGLLENGIFYFTPNVYITQHDIRQFQMAKSAIYSGILTLLKEKNIRFEQVDHLYISGGFSSCINMKSAAIIGLFPKELATKSISLNNSSLLGTFKYACEDERFSICLDHAEYLDLSQSSEFSKLFIQNMLFEYT